ncbi:hypothetical protein HPB47_003909 [Ixodes persulcatus]|uniref:Uncharacterized protein n=1 Tax=Ixodes persulcatus TaxID=34615 RepID=A0AC60PI95_IXOPE|nr:hypothetical protein HPB47_003909 [Ixodes persulcatus]
MSTRTHAKSVLIDLSGTLHVEDLVIPGAIEALQRLRDAGLKIRFVTNTTKESRKCLHKRLACLGFNIDENEMFSSLTAARSYVETRKLRPYLMVAEASMEEFAGLDTSDPNAVVIGLAPDKFDFGPMNEAFRLVSKGASLIAIHKGRYYRTHSGLSLGPGPFVAALEYATDVKAKVVGKPEKGFFESVLKLLDTRPEDAVMIGDSMKKRERQILDTDIFCVAVYMDPHYRLLLTLEQKYRATLHLTKSWRRITALQCEQDSGLSSEAAAAPEDVKDALEALPKEKEVEAGVYVRGTRSPLYIACLLEMLDKEPRLSWDANVFQFSEETRERHPELCALAQVALGVPANQINEERAFSGVHFIVSEMLSFSGYAWRRTASSVSCLTLNCAFTHVPR